MGAVAVREWDQPFVAVEDPPGGPVHVLAVPQAQGDELGEAAAGEPHREAGALGRGLPGSGRDEVTHGALQLGRVIDDLELGSGHFFFLKIPSFFILLLVSGL